MIDFSIPPELEATRQSVIAFMDQYVYPSEKELVEDEGLPAALESELQKRVKEQVYRRVKTETVRCGRLQMGLAG